MTEKGVVDDEYAEIAIELGETAKYHCPCCGKESETVHGFLYERSGATSVYFAGYTPGHTDRRANMVLSIGRWGEGATPADRSAVAVQISYVGRDLVVAFPSPETSPWYGKDFLGKMLSPKEMSGQDRTRYSGLARVAALGDPRVFEYLQTKQ